MENSRGVMASYKMAAGAWLAVPPRIGTRCSLLSVHVKVRRRGKISLWVQRLTKLAIARAYCISMATVDYW